MNMESWLHYRWLAVISCLLYVGLVQGDCPGDGIGIEGGRYKLTKQLQQGSVLVYECSEGYYPHPHFSRHCQHSGRWKPQPDRNLKQQCKLVECPSPIVLGNGDVFPREYKYLLGNETTYECYSGYTLKGSTRRVCKKNGKWDGRTPTCSEDSGSENACPDPGNPPGSRRSGNRFGLDDKVTYSCGQDMILVGSKERTCLESGQWSGRETECYYKHTYDTPEEVSHAFAGSIRESLTTLQSTDDTTEGRKIRILKNGTLNIYIGMDVSESIDEKDIASAKEAVRLLIKKISSFTVTPNYDVVYFTSVVQKAVDILDFFDENYNRNTMLDDIAKFQIDQSAGGTDLSNVFKHFLEQMTHIQNKVGDKTFATHYHVIIVFTDGGYNEGGDPLPTVTRIKNMVYLSDIPGQHDPIREEHLDIYAFGIGEVFHNTLMPLTAGLGGQHFFKMEDIHKLNETFDKMIDESQVRDLCGLHRSYQTEFKDNARKTNPWFAHVIIQNGPVKMCFGSLVTTKFVLTAAHCFRATDLPKHVKVEIGDGEKKVRTVKTFMLHEDFNIAARKNQGVPEFYDYDVALIQLENDVEISDEVRPICLPCTKQTRDALRMDDKSTCKQQQELLLGEDTVRLSFLTRASHEDYSVHNVLVKDVHAKLRSSRPDCIKHALTAYNMTAKDPEIPVTKNFLCTGGTSPNVDHIACTGDSGGAVFKDYEYRHVQVGVVSWGSQEMCQSGGMKRSSAISRDFHINVFTVLPFLKRILGNDAQDVYQSLEFMDISTIE